MSKYILTWLTVATLLTLTLGQPGSANDNVTAVSRDGLYRLTFTAELSPIEINRIHRWTLHLADRDGNPVTGAHMTVTGGMPEHNHGFPTNPVVTDQLGNGDYRLEGMRFHMQGAWEISVSIDGSEGRDTVVLELVI